jgi:glutathione peroxidase
MISVGSRDATEIKVLCGELLGDFPLTEKCRVIGAERTRFTAGSQRLSVRAGSPAGTHKYLVGPDGQLAGAWPAKSPDRQPNHQRNRASAAGRMN